MLDERLDEETQTVALYPPMLKCGKETLYVVKAREEAFHSYGRHAFWFRA